MFPSMFSADWALKRVLKFILKRSVGRFLQNEVDLDQLDVQLGTGTLELRDVLLHCDNINQHLALEGWQVKAGYVGALRASIPISSTSSDRADVELDELLLTITPKPASATPTAAGAKAGDAPAEPAAPTQLLSLDEIGLGSGQAGVVDGIRRIAGGLERLLQQLSLVVHNVAIRVEIPPCPGCPTGAEFTLRCDAIHYFDSSPMQAGSLPSAVPPPPPLQPIRPGTSPAARSPAASSPLQQQYHQHYQQHQQQQQQQQQAASELVKNVEVRGLTLELLELSEADDSCAGGAVACEAWPGQGPPSPARSCCSDTHSDALFDLEDSNSMRSSGHAASLLLGADIDAAGPGAAAYGSSGSPSGNARAGRRRSSSSASPNAAGGGHGSEQQGLDHDYAAVVLSGPSRTGLDAVVQLKLTWQDKSHTQPQISADVNFSAARLQLTPGQLPLLGALQECLGQAQQQAQQQGQQQQQQQPLSPQQQYGRSAPAGGYRGGLAASMLSAGSSLHSGAGGAEEWGRRSLVEELFFPHCDGIVAESLGWDPASSLQASGLGGRGLGHGAAAASSAPSNDSFHDARSVFGSLTSSMLGSTSNFLSNVYSTVSSGLGHNPGARSAASARPAGAASSLHPPSPAWSMQASCPQVALVLCYCGSGTTTAGSSVGGSSASDTAGLAGAPWLGPDLNAMTCAPRFTLECAGLVVGADFSHGGAQASLKLYRVEAGEQLPSSCVAGMPFGATPAELVRVPHLLPPTAQGLRPVPLYGRGVPQQHGLGISSSPSAASGESSTIGTAVNEWPVLCFGGGAMEAPGLPNVTRPSICIKASSQASSSVPGRTTKAAADVELLPVTVWLSVGLLQRLNCFLEPFGVMQAALAASKTGQQGQPVAQQQQQLPNAQERRSHAAGVRFSDGRMGAQQERNRARAADHAPVQVTVDTLSQDLQGSAQPVPQPQVPFLPGADLQATVNVAHVCVVLALQAPEQQPAQQQSPQQQQQQSYRQLLLGQRYAVLDVSAVCVTDASAGHHHHLGRHRPNPAGPRPLLRCRRRKPSGSLVQQEPPTVVELCLTRLRGYLVGSPYADAKWAGKLHATCILDAAPSTARTPGVTTHPTTDSSVGPEDVPAGAALFAELTLDPSAAPHARLVAEALALAEQHAADRWAEAEDVACGWEDAASFGALDLQQRCKKGSAAFAHVRAPRLSTCVSKDNLLGLGRALAALLEAQAGIVQGPGSAVAALMPSTAAVSQVAVLLQCRLRANLQAPLPLPNAGNSSMAAAQQPLTVRSSAAKAAVHAASSKQRLQQGQQQGAGSFDLTAFEAAVEELTVFAVSNLGGCAGASAMSVSLQGVQLLRGAARTVCVFCPATSRATSNPGVQLLTVSPAAGVGPGSSSVLGLGLTSVLISGATVSLDAGSMGASWANELAAFWQPGDASTLGAQQQGAQQQQQQQQQQQRVVLNMQDIAIRAEPADTPPTAHNVGRIAAALVVEGVHWPVDLTALAPQHINIHSLSVHVAAAAKRGSANGGWGPNVARDVPGATLSANGYHCVAQEGALSLVLRPDVRCGEAHDGAHSTWELEVTNQNLVGTLHKESAALLVQLISYWSEEYMARCPPPPPRMPHGVRDSKSSSGVNSSSGSGAASLTAAAMQQHILTGIKEGTFTPHTPSTAPGPDPRLAASVYLAGGWYGDATDTDTDAESSTDTDEEPARAAALAAAAAAAAAVAGTSAEAAAQQPLAPIILDNFYGGSPPRSGSGSSSGRGRTLNGVRADSIGRSSSGRSSHSGWDGAVVDAECGQGRWYGAAGASTFSTHSAAAAAAAAQPSTSRTAPAAPIAIQEDYVQSPLQPMGSGCSAAELDGATSSGACMPAPYGLPAPDPSAPCPVSRVALRGLSAMLVLHERAPGARGGGGEGRLEVEVEGLTLISEAYGAEGHHANRFVLVLGGLEVRDCGAHKEGAGGAKWIKVLSQRGKRGQGAAAMDPVPGVVGVRVPLLTVVQDAVRPDPVAEPNLEEYRLAVALLPLRLRLDQDVVAFLSAFFGAISAAAAASAEASAAAKAALAAESGTDFEAASRPAAAVAVAGGAGAGAAGGAAVGDAESLDAAAPYFQRVEVRGFSLLIDYRPRRIDIAALRDGAFSELLNLVPWGGVDLAFKPLRLSGIAGWDGIAGGAAKEWMHHISRTQAHKFVTGVAPISSVVRVGSAVAGLLAVPAAHITASRRDGTLRHLDGQLSRQLRRSTATFVRALVYEALGLGATVAGGAQMVLQGGPSPAPSETPSGVMDGLRQAKDRLSAGFGAAADTLVVVPVRAVQKGEVTWREAASKALRAAPAAAAAPASAAAAAVRYTLLGVRSAMDPERKEQ